MFTRDRRILDEEFPDLEVMIDRPHTHPWYVASGGVNFRQVLPDSFTPFVRFLERLLTPFNRWLALQQTVVLRKRPGASPAV